MGRYLIWWLSQDDCERIGEMHYFEDLEGKAADGFLVAENVAWPDYIKRAYISRFGRAGNGRLWVPSHIKLGEIPRDDAKPIKKVLGRSGDIVIESKDARYLRGYPGILTTVDLVKVSPFRRNLLERIRSMFRSR